MPGSNTTTVSEHQEKFEEFFKEQYQEKLENLATQYPEKKSLVINYKDLDRYDPELSEALVKDPYNIIDHAEKALAEQDLMTSLEEHEFEPNVRITNLPQEYYLRIKELKSKQINRMIAFEGTVKKITEVKPKITQGVFECVHCGKIHKVKQNYRNNKVVEPNKCRSCDRKSFKLLEDESNFIDTQKIAFQEPLEKTSGKEQAKPISGWVEDDLTNTINPGDKVDVYGVLRIQQSKDKGSIYNKYIDINNVEMKETEFEELELTEKDIEEIKELSNDPLIYEKITSSIAPSIYGYEDIKEAISLQLFGGTKGKEKPDGMHIRPDIHILLIGDPGTAKSQLLQYVEGLSPKGIYVSGKSSSAAGLCVAPDTFMPTDQGYYQINNFVEERLNSPKEIQPGMHKSDCREGKLYGLNNSYSLSKAPLESVWEIEAPPTMTKIKTRTGREIEITPETSLPVSKQGDIEWIKAKNLEKKDRVATPRKIKVKGKTPYLHSYIQEDYTILNIGPFVKKLKEELREKHGTLKEAAEELEIDENNIYCWSNNDLQGNPSIKDLKKILRHLGEDQEKLYNEIDGRPLSQQAGHKIQLPTRPNEELMRIIGMIAGDGSICGGTSYGGRTIRFSSSNNHLRKQYKELLENLNINYYESQGSEKRPPEIRFGSKIFADILHKFGIPNSPKSSKLTLSKKLLNLKDNLIAAYLKGLFDTDGCVKKRDSGSDTIELYTTSKKLAERVQHSLLRFGVISKVRTRERNNRTTKIQGKREITTDKNMHIVTIRGSRNIKNFKEEIGISHPEKRKKLQSIQENKELHSNIDTIPGTGTKLKDIREYLGVSRSTYPTNGGGKRIEKGKSTTRKTLRRLVDSLIEVIRKDEWKGKRIKIDKKLRKSIRKKLKKTTTAKEMAEKLNISTSQYQEYFQRLTREPKIPFRTLSQVADHLREKGFSKTTEKIKDKIWSLEAREQTILSEALTLKTLANSDVFWDEVKKVEEIEPSYDKVYDVTVNQHNFLANNVLVHNTATAEKDEFGEEGWTLKAGALVLAAGGMALVDELDKIEESDRSSLHQAMESQKISVAKAGIVSTFKANAAILAAANPKYGRFDPYELPAEQFDIPPTLMSRFDLMFPVKDTPDEEKDNEMAEHILLTHRAAGRRAKGESIEEESEEQEAIPSIDPDLLRKYIAYARKNIQPVVTEEAEERIREFYVDLRKVGEEQEAVPITARQLEAVVRLAEASAKGRLSEKVELEDAERAIRLQKTCLKKVGVDPETGQFDIDIIATGSSKSQMDKMKTVMNTVKRINDEYDEATYDAIKEEAKEEGVDEEDLDDILKELKKNGDVYTPSYNVYKPTEE